MFVLEECTVNTIRAAFETGELTSYGLTMMYIDRIARYDKSGPALNSVLEINPDAVFIAQAMDRERKAGKVRSPLHGVPILLKDNINTHDKLCTSAGSIALKDNYASYDAALVKKLRDAGLVILGKANMTEFANFMSYNMRSGYSSRGGQVKNPYNLDAEVWGSSSGSAVSVSANLCALAIGTETNGSIMSPSHINGCVGIKPTIGLVSRHGIIPISTTQDTAGPMTKTVADAAALLNIIAGYDENDPSTWAQEENIACDYTACLNPGAVKGMRIGINRAAYDDRKHLETLDEEGIGFTENAVKVLEGLGATMIQDTNISNVSNNLNVMLYEFKKALNAYLATTPPSVKNRTLKDIIDYMGEHPGEGLKYGMGRLLDAEFNTSGGLTDPAYIESRFECLQASQKEGIDKIMAEHQLDVIINPMFNALPPVSGYPSISVPAGYRKDGTPFGIMFMGSAFSEPKLIAAAYAYEQASKIRKAPVLK